MQTSLGAGARRASAAALRTRYLAARSSAGPRFAWPRLRRHLEDKIGLPLQKDDGGAVLIKNPRDARQSSVEL